MASKRTPVKKAKQSGKPATLRDIAERADVHLSTVSRVLNPATGKVISNDVAERIRAIAKEMGYRTNPFGYGLRTKKSNTIGVVIPDLTNPVFPPIIRGIEHALRDFDYTAILADSDESVKDERVIIERMQSRQVEGLILATAHRADQIVANMIQYGTPTVLINRTTDDDRVLSVTNDDYRGAMLAVDHLLELGHRKIAHLAGPQYLATGHRRKKGYLEAIKRRKIKANKNLLITCDAFGVEDGYKGFNKLLKCDVPFSAIFCGNDALALGCYNAMHEAGLSCPDDISIIGYNNMPFVDMVQPALSTVQIDLYQMGIRAAKILMNVANAIDEPSIPVILDPELIVRESTAVNPFGDGRGKVFASR